jgi:hypothetical protein
MKIVFFFILLLVSQSKLLADGGASNEMISFKASFTEGFGIYLKKEVTLKRVDTAIGAKAEGEKSIYIIINNKNISGEIKEEKLLELICSEEDEAKLIKDFGDKTKIKVVIGGYESIGSFGIPGKSKSVRDDEDFETPAGIGWSARQFFMMKKYEIVAE